MPDLLLEIGTEEIPARMLDAASDELARRITGLLDREHLAKVADRHAPSTPRRLAFIARGLALRQPDTCEQVTGPPVKAAFKDGSPTAAAHAFAKKAGIAVEQLQRVTTPKGEYLAAQVTTKGRTALEVLADALPREIAAIYWPKNMYWRAGKPERFVRPIRWIVALLDHEIIPLEFAGLRAGRESRGHRILSKGTVLIDGCERYDEILRGASVEVRPQARRAKIVRELENAVTAASGLNRVDANRKTGFRWRRDDALLDTVVNLTEFPSVILGTFDQEFLSLPEEVLVTVMRDHQKYFAVEDQNQKLAPHFLAVLNTSSDPDGLIRHGNERVLRARFNDARFFWETDQKLPLRDRVELLKHVTFQKDLGSYYEKTIRVQHLGSLVCETLRSAEVSIRAGIVHKSALLCKTDLTTELVKEFTELQGIVGGLYARVQQLHRPNEPALPDEARQAVAQAIYEHYQPESMDDAVPSTLAGAVLSLCDKADTIAGMLALGLIPSGSKDPFALRRQANAVIRIIAEHKLPLSASLLFLHARSGYKDSTAEPKLDWSDKFEGDIRAFIRERLDFYLREARGFAYDVVNAVLNAGSDRITDAVTRAEAVAQVRSTDDFLSISIAFKRIKNILAQARQKGIAIPVDLAMADLGESEEIALERLVSEILPRYNESVRQHRYTEALSTMANLRTPVDRFFDKVMVMDPDSAKRNRRLALLHTLNHQFSRVADFSEIVTESK